MKGLVVFTLLAVAGFSQTAEGGKVIHRVIQVIEEGLGGNVKG